MLDSVAVSRAECQEAPQFQGIWRGQLIGGGARVTTKPVRRIPMKASFLVATLTLGLSLNAFASPITYTAIMNGPNESPANGSPGTGFAVVVYDPIAHTLDVDVSFANLTVGSTASHIHCCTTVPDMGTAGVATQVPTFTGFPLGVTSGTYDHLFDMTLLSTYNPAFVTANGGTASTAEVALADGLASGESYLNIHTTNFPGGEIRGFLSPVPEPEGLAVVGLIIGGVVELHRRRRVLRGLIA